MASNEYSIRTDLALEIKERLANSEKNLRGISYQEEKKENGVIISRLSIDSENAVKTIGRPKGKYITIEAPQMSVDDLDYHREVSEELARVLLALMKEINIGKEYAVLVVGLGNRQVTPDALGPQVVDNLLITRHIMKEYGKYAFGSENVNSVSGIVPGVMAQTGMESLEIIQGIVKETSPDLVITVDALAARSTKRLGCTIQLTDTGIVPGSGVGNHRKGINKDNLGVPVISIGIPTVIDAVTIVSDAVNAGRDATEKLLSPKLNGMFVTPKDIDDTIKQLGFLISEGLNIAFSDQQ